jgi:hypothetical protein
MNMTRKAQSLFSGVLLVGLLGNPESEAKGDDPEGVLYFFTTPEAEGGPEGAKRLVAFANKHPGKVKLRPVLLAHDWSLLQTVTEKSPLTRTLKELEAGGKPGTLDIPLFDEEGLLLAERWQLRSVPAFVLVRGGRAHRTSGAGSDLEELWECSK